MIFGNKFSPNHSSLTTRASGAKNIYLEAGTVISLKDSTTYSYAVYRAANETSTSGTGNLGSASWHTATLTVDTDGWYGLTFKHNVEGDFDFGGADPNVLSGYVNITK